MRRPAVALALAVLAALAGSGSRPCGAASLPAGALLDSVCVNYTRLSRFHFEGLIRAEIRSDTSTKVTTVDVPFVYAAERPRRLHTEFRNPFMSTVFVADGESLYIAAPALHEYTVQAAPEILPGGGGSDPRAGQLDPLLPLAAVREHAIAVRDAGADTVVQATGPVMCRRLVVEYGPDSTHAGLTFLPRMLWIDEARRLIARDSLVALVQHPQLGLVHNTQTTRFTLADPSAPGPDSLFRFTPAPDLARSAQFGDAATPQPAPDLLAGKAAPPFALTTLAGRRVSLAALRGHVVVLDFWATWCGPCRRWLPIVAGVERRAAAQGVRVYAVNLRETPAEVRGYLARARLALPVLLDRDGHVGDAYGAQAIPLTVVIGRDGKVSRSLVGLHEEADLVGALRDAGVKGL